MDLIIGAGVSGLSYAAKTKNEYVIVEKSGEIGGYCKTIYSGDYVWDYSGHFFHFQHPEIKDYVMRNISEDEILKVLKRTQIYYKGIMVDYPFQMNIHQLEKEELIDCLYDLFTIPEKAEIDSFKSMLFAKFGKSIAEKFLIPYNEKLYAIDLNRLDVDAMGRFFPYANKEDIIRNFRNPEDKSYNTFFLYPKRGVIRIINSIAQHVDLQKIAFNESLLSVDMQNKVAITDKRAIPFDRLISTVPFPMFLDMNQIQYDKNIYSWNKVLVFNLGFDKKGKEKLNNWIYFPDRELVFYRVGFYDNIIGQDKMSLYVEIGFNHDDEEIDIAKYRERVLDDLRKVGIINEEKVVAEHHVLMDPAYVHITKQSEIDKSVKKKILAEHDVYSIGRYGSWTYCSLEDNIFEAFALADEICKQ
jgi:protoporphyrinogen oxidase